MAGSPEERIGGMPRSPEVSKLSANIWGQALPRLYGVLVDSIERNGSQEVVAHSPFETEMLAATIDESITNWDTFLRGGTSAVVGSRTDADRKFWKLPQYDEDRRTWSVQSAPLDYLEFELFLNRYGRKILPTDPAQSVVQPIVTLSTMHKDSWQEVNEQRKQLDALRDRLLLSGRSAERVAGALNKIEALRGLIHNVVNEQITVSLARFHWDLRGGGRLVSQRLLGVQIARTMGGSFAAEGLLYTGTTPWASPFDLSVLAESGVVDLPENHLKRDFSQLAGFITKSVMDDLKKGRR